jgi:hypothetical protein
MVAKIFLGSLLLDRLDEGSFPVDTLHTVLEDAGCH